MGESPSPVPNNEKSVFVKMQNKLLGDKDSAQKSIFSTPDEREPVYYKCGDSLYDMLVLLGLLLGSCFWSIDMIMNHSTLLPGLLLSFYTMVKIAIFVLGYMSIKGTNRLFFAITILIAGVALVFVVYLFARAFTDFFAEITLHKIFVFIVHAVELLSKKVDLFVSE
ncbi:unnamed protein product [Cylicocyclus nassatus]|uniref:Uncharacterized protein n=1 Tax=Cylicocyclus nassatus TaxID=53992 RepID=A0AA36M2V7_CYLNA|nr:unnamed protein product [Cylicocyclus nassatus]